ncbi:SH3 domain-containing protein [Nostoc sp. 'Lobaria pulmonaria (5183) cyanobiont']|uniref:SH3 domain-containing protein n=1 Tax=Nostoc sp. 'Lobaria pulmonaria (5183) cyanobiont' TaxID=1618022 RepID=UPI000CF3534B|nr:SH3 domain-containing protein [Nostoc sp. 'Lobaria pulmonaria (5183) cyanobiont']AVH73751.1 SH3 type 3 domain-containing protein [Nostoc sp. 'Lobaria pulmonaria (5183) cyanobiont']
MLSGFTKFILGFFLAIAVLVGGGVAIALYFMNRTGISPAKPVFSNDSPSVKAQAPKATKPGEGKSTLPSGTQAESSPTSTSTPTESPKATPSPKPLPPGAYRGRVSWAEGLSLRSQPNQESEKIGGVGFNQKIIILQESDDKSWQKIRLEGSEQEGWVKAGNTEKVDQQ